MRSLAVRQRFFAAWGLRRVSMAYAAVRTAVDWKAVPASSDRVSGETLLCPPETTVCRAIS
jgi:hypothetical protein